MQLMVGNMIMMYEDAIKKDHNKFEGNAQAHISWMTWEYKMQQGNHNVSQSMHKMQICHVCDMSIEHDMCEHNQQIWRCWCTNARCRGMSEGSKVLPISPSAPQCEGP